MNSQNEHRIGIWHFDRQNVASLVFFTPLLQWNLRMNTAIFRIRIRDFDKSCFLLLLECGIRALALPKLFCTVKSYKETSILLYLCARNESGIEAIIVYCPWFFITTGDTQAEGDGKMNGSSSSSTVLPPHLKEHERPPLLVNCEVSLLHEKMLLIPWKYCGWDAQSQPEIAGNFSQAFILCPCTPGEVSFLTSCLTTGPPSSLLLQSQKSVVVWSTEECPCVPCI